MDLWIRSQDRQKLIKIDKIYYEMVEAPLDEYGDVLCDYDICSDNEILGTYPTEERALEILDIIEHLLLGDVLVFKNCDIDFENKTLVVSGEHDKKSEVNFIDRHCVVYEMPKE